MNMKFASKGKGTLEWDAAKKMSALLKALPANVVDSARVVPVNFPGNLLQPTGSAGHPWLFFAGEHVSHV